MTFEKDEFNKYSDMQGQIDTLLIDFTREVFQMKNMLKRKFLKAQTDTSKVKREAIENASRMKYPPRNSRYNNRRNYRRRNDR